MADMKVRQKGAGFNPVVKKLHRSMLASLGSELAEKGDNHAGLSSKHKLLSRKQRRKQARMDKKAKHIAYTTKRNSKLNVSDQVLKPIPAAAHEEEISVKSGRKPPKNPTSSHQSRSALQQAKEKFDREAKAERRKQQRREIKDEDKILRKLEKQLGLNKRKKQTRLPKSFTAEGLTYAMNFLEESDAEVGDTAGDANSSDFSDSIDSENLSDQESELESPKSTEVPELTKRKIAQTAIVNESSNACKKRVRFADDNGVVEQDHGQQGKESSKELKEDIYGRVIDSSGMVVPAAAKKLPALDDPGDSQSREKLKKQIKGLINRLSECNANGIANQISDLYNTHSHADVKYALTEHIFEALIKTDRLPNRLLLEGCYLLGLLYNKTSNNDIGAYFVEKLSVKFDGLLLEGVDSQDDKRLDNTLLIFSFLYHLKIIHSDLIFDIIKVCLKRFAERDIECLLLLLTHVGFGLRKDDPAQLKEIIQVIQSKASSEQGAALKDHARVRYMLETLLAIKNNNVQKVTGYDPFMVEHFLKLLRGIFKGGLEAPLKISLSDLLNAEQKGRWWVVGSAWTSANQSLLFPGDYSATDGKNVSDNVVKDDSKKKEEYSAELLRLAKKFRMNTDQRRTVFCVIMSAEDYLDAFEKLLKLGFKDQQERELIHICLTCALYEKTYNPFYGYLLERFCSYHKRFKLTTQYAVWDKLKSLATLSSVQRKNLALVILQLIRCNAVTLAVLKIVEFAEIDDAMTELLKTVFTDLLMQSSDDELKTIFKRIAGKDALKSFTEALKLFMQHFLLGSGSQEGGKGEKKLKDRIDMVERLLYNVENHFAD